MIKVVDTIYPSFLASYSEKMLQINFMPTAAEIVFVKTKARQQDTQKLLLILLKASQYLHHVPLPSTIPYVVIKYVVAFLGAKPLQKKYFKQYQHSGTYKRHSQMIRDYLKFNIDTDERQMFCHKNGTSIAQTKDNLIDVINALIELIVKQQFELPAFSTIEKLARTCRTGANEILYQKLCHTLKPVQVEMLENLLKPAEPNTLWQRLKKTPDKPTVSHIRDFLKHMRWLKSLAQPLPSLDVLPISKRVNFRDEAMALHSSDMKSLKKSKRLALIITLVKSQLGQAFDDLTDMLIRVLNEIEQAGKSAYQHDIYETKGNSDALISEFREFLTTYQDSLGIDAATDRLETIDATLSEKSEAMMAACDAHLERNKHAEKPHIVKAFRQKRSLLFQMLCELPIDAVSSHAELISMRQKLSDLHQQHKHEVIRLTLSKNLLKKLSSGWSELILSSQKPTQLVNRYALETAWFIAIARQLKTYNCFVPDSVKYADPNEQLISWEEYTSLVEKYAKHRDISVEDNAFVQTLKQSLTTLAVSDQLSPRYRVCPDVLMSS